VGREQGIEAAPSRALAIRHPGNLHRNRINRSRASTLPCPAARGSFD
jgi:hypothetical protein